MSTISLYSLGLTLGMSVLSGGVLLGRNFDKVQILCQEYNNLEQEHKILKEKVYDIHTKVCLIDQKLNTLIKK